MLIIMRRMNTLHVLWISKYILEQCIHDLIELVVWIQVIPRLSQSPATETVHDNGCRIQKSPFGIITVWIYARPIMTRSLNEIMSYRFRGLSPAVLILQDITAVVCFCNSSRSLFAHSQTKCGTEGKHSPRLPPPL